MAERPVNPHLVLAAALVLPGAGQVMIGQPQRGLVFLFFIIIFGWIGNRLMLDGTFFVRHVGSIFLYGLAVIDSYKRARIRMATWEHGERQARAAT